MACLVVLNPILQMNVCVCVCVTVARRGQSANEWCKHVMRRRRRRCQWRNGDETMATMANEPTTRSQKGVTVGLKRASRCKPTRVPTRPTMLLPSHYRGRNPTLVNRWFHTIPYYSIETSKLLFYMWHACSSTTVSALSSLHWGYKTHTHTQIHTAITPQCESTLWSKQWNDPVCINETRGGYIDISPTGWARRH